MSNKIDPKTPYLAPAAPTSPMRQAVVSFVLAAVSLVSLLLGLDVAVDPEAITALVSAGFGVWALVMHRRARDEQAAGVQMLESMRAADLAEPPGALDSGEGEVLR